MDEDDDGNDGMDEITNLNN